MKGGLNPYVSLPPQIRGLDPAWKDCIIIPTKGSWDPPYALQTAPGPLTAAGPIITEPPAAGATLISPQPQATQDPSTPHPWNPTAISARPAPSAPAAPVDPQPSAPAAPVHPQPSLPRLFSISALDPVASPAQSNVPGNNSPQVVPVDPALTVPAQNPPAQNPPGQNPPGQNPPSQNPPGQNPPAPILTLLNRPITPNSNSVYLIASQTLRAGGPAITVAGTPISLAPSATALYIAGTASPIMPAPVHPMLFSSNPAVPSNPHPALPTRPFYAAPNPNPTVPQAPGPAITTLTDAFTLGAKVYTATGGLL